MVWIFLVLIGTSIGLVLLIQRSNAPADSQAGNLQGIFLDVQAKDNRLVYSLNEVAEYQLTFRDTTGATNSFNGLTLKIQYPKEFLEPEAEFFTLGSAILPVNEEVGECRALDGNSACIELDLAKASSASLKDGEIIANVFFKVINNTREPADVIFGTEISTSFNEEVHSFVTTANNEAEVPLLAEPVQFKVQNKCLGDYNGLKSAGSEVDIEDLALFGSKFGVLLNEKDIFNFDLVPNAASCEDCSAKLDEADLKVILCNYVSNSCKFDRDNIPTDEEILNLQCE